MTAVTLFDVMREAETAPNAAGERREPRILAFAERMVAALREEYQRLLDYERDFDFRDLDQERELHILRTIWRAFDSWSEEVERVMA